MEKKYHIIITLRNGVTHEFDSEYGWDADVDKMNDPRNKFYEFPNGGIILATDEIAKIEKTVIAAEDK